MYGSRPGIIYGSSGSVIPSGAYYKKDSRKYLRNTYNGGASGNDVLNSPISNNGNRFIIECPVYTGRRGKGNSRG